MALTALSCLVSCARGPGVKRFYESLREPLEGLDASGVRGRKIVIDAGHGGVFRGARGPSGFDEADANLGVALELGRMLKEAGAVVTLTRTADVDFVSGDSLRLADDLRARVAIVNRVNPDLFVSLHHNADLRSDPSFNEIQVYYRLQDQGPSLDAARAIASHLLQNLGEERGRVIGGNYHVLRNSIAPAVLCEPSFITNPAIESRIKLAEKQQLEASTYFLGIVDYFSGGVPEVAAVKISGADVFRALEADTTGPARGGQTSIEDARPLVEVDFDTGTIIDAATVDLRVDGAGLEVVRGKAGTFLAFPGTALGGGTHTISVSARSTGGNASREVTREFKTATEPSTIAVAVDPAQSDNSNPQRVTAVVSDRNGKPIADSTIVIFSWSSGSLERRTLDGEARVYTGKDLPFVPGTVVARCGDLESSVTLRPDTSEAGAAGKTAASGLVFLSGFVADEAGRPVEGAVVAAEESAGACDSTTEAKSRTGSAVTDRDGYFILTGEARQCRFSVSRRGFRRQSLTAEGETYPVVTITPFYRGLRAPLRIAIDAEGGGDATGPVGPTGATSSRSNLLVALRLRDLLNDVGIETLLTRDTDENVTREDRVRKVEAWKPALLLTIAHSVASSSHAEVAHYPNSAAGMRAATLIGEEIREVLRKDSAIRETADYIVQQSSCPAVKVTFFGPRTAKQDAIWTDPGEAWLRAYAQMCAVVRFLGLEEADTLPVTWEVLEEGSPSPGCLISVDGTLEAIADKSGHCALRLIELGPHTAQIWIKSGLDWSGTFDTAQGIVRVNLTRGQPILDSR